MNRETLIELTDIEVVADYISLDVVRKRNRSYIRCPGHLARLGKPDLNIGNAYLKNGGYVCHACGVFVNTHDMIMEVTDCSYDEAYEIMAQAMGYDLSDTIQDGNIPRLCLTKAEANIIGLYQRFNEIAVQKSNNNYSLTIRDGLFSLYQSNPKMYFKIIVEKAREAMKRYQYCKQHYSTPDSDMAYVVYDLLGEKFDNSIYPKILRELDSRIETCKKIIAIFSTSL